jgi:hypothetical protein
MVSEDFSGSQSQSDEI